MVAYITNHPQNAIERARTLETGTVGTFPRPHTASKHPSLQPTLVLSSAVGRGTGRPGEATEATRNQRKGSHMHKPDELRDAALASLRPDMSHCWLLHLELKPNQPGLCQFSWAERTGAAVG